jgi:acyl-CoA synthetase (AMP-forming)/AMP-acid ligase II
VPFPAHLRVVSDAAAAAFAGEPVAHVRGIDLDRAVIIYTSGSTGRPRGATLSHLNVVANTRSILEYLRLTGEDSVLQVLPFPYVFGLSLLHTHVAVGGTIVLHDNMVFPDTALDAMDRERVTGFAGVPATFAILLNRSSLARRRIPSLRYVAQAGGGMPLPHLKQLIEALPGVRIFVMYGATEAAARLSWLEPEMLAAKLGSIGRAIPNVELTIRRDDGAEAPVDEVGEIVARGSNIMEGYWGDAVATREVLDAHGFHTGDLGRRDEDGYFWITGRKREMIKSGAHRISPKEIEDALLEHPEIEEAAVVGRADEYMGEVIVAHVTVRPQPSVATAGEPRAPRVTPEQLREFCQERLPAHKVPQEVLIRDAMPRNASGKLDKRALREGTARTEHERGTTEASD